MTTRPESEDILLNAFQDAFTLGYAVQYENNPDFTKPTNLPWVRFTIKGVDSTQTGFAQVGDRTFDRPGLISYQVFIPKDTGTYDGNTACELINNIFEGNKFGDIYCEAGYYKKTGVQNDGFFQYNGRIFYHFDEHK